VKNRILSLSYLIIISLLVVGCSITTDESESNYADPLPIQEIQEMAGLTSLNGNLVNDGYTAMDKNNRILLSDMGGVYSLASDGDLSLLNEDSARFMNIDQYFLYYIDFIDQESIVKLDLQSHDSIPIYELKEDDKHVSWMFVQGSELYFYNGDLKSIDLDSLEVEVLLEDIPMFTINMDKQNIYYADDKSISKYNLSEKTTSKIADIPNLYSFVLDNDYIYYMQRNESKELLKCDCSIQRMDIDGQQNMILKSFEDNIHSLNIDSSWIYYVKDHSIYRTAISEPYNEEQMPLNNHYRLLGEEWSLIPEEDMMYSPSSMNIVGDWLFYDNIYGHNSYLQGIRMEGNPGNSSVDETLIEKGADSSNELNTSSMDLEEEEEEPIRVGDKIGEGTISSFSVNREPQHGRNIKLVCRV
jgi:hypothetical protein